MMMPFPLSLPSGATTWFVTLLVFFAFGFVLERAGFGDSRRLAAQFYLHEMRVLKVMFGGIVTCLLLLHWSGALGWVELSQIYVNPTYFGSAIVGGFVLGMGFIVGGYCPGTSLVAAATGKLDGALFVAGVATGIVVFRETLGWVRDFFETSGALGRLRLPEWFGVDGGVVVLGIVLLALFMFWGAEKLESAFARLRPKGYDE